MDKKWVNISTLAALVHGEWHGAEDVAVYAMADISQASAGQLAFIDNSRKLADVGGSAASALIVPRDGGEFQQPVIRVADPAWAAAVIHNYLLKTDFVAEGINSRACVGKNCSISKQVTVGPMAVIGDRVKIGDRVRIGAGVVIGNDVEIGADVTIHPNVTILDGSLLGSRVIIHSGTVVGSDGFGYAHDNRGKHVKRPHVGFVQIDDDVEIGANVCIDRATFGRTRIGSGAKIDNLVQIAHNVEIGEDSIMVAQSGISGSTILGRGVVMGGKAAVSGHLKIGDRVTMAAKAGVISDQEAGVVVAGFPAFSHKKWLRASAAFQKLPDLIKEVREIKTRMKEILEKLTEKTDPLE